MSPQMDKNNDSLDEDAPPSDGAHEIVHSLGEALAGVSLGASAGFTGSSVGQSSFSFHSTGTGTADDGWGGTFAEPSGAPAPFSAPSSSPMPEDIHQQLRNQSIERFLTQSPSQTLGEDVFKLSHTNLPALNNDNQQNESSNLTTAFAFSAQTLAPGPSNISASKIIVNEGRIESRASPVTSATGTATSSRSASPYASDNNRTIGAYHHSGFDARTQSSDNGYAGLGHSQNSHPSLPSLDTRSPFSSAGRTSFDAPETANAPGGTGQVLYMAVPAPDGRGQVLQPVQIVQTAPGKPISYVVPKQGSTGPVEQPPVMVMSKSKSSEPTRGYDAKPYSIPTSSANSSNSLDNSFLDEYQPSSGITDPAISSLYSSPQRPPLDQLLGQIRRLSRDQVGCRLVQQALDEEGAVAATLILNEGLPFWGECMVDPFGNYLFQKIAEKVTAEERIMLVQSVSNRLVNASLNLHGTRSVQKIVEVCAHDEKMGAPKSDLGDSSADLLVKALAPAAARLCIDSHGNHVIQRILLKLGYKHSKFIFDAVATSVGDVARHRHGCCVIQRCLDSPPSDARAYLVSRIVEKSLELMQDAYGNYVVQYVLDVCSDEDVHAVCDSVAGRVNLLSIQKFSSNVMEKCLERCSERTKEAYLKEMSDPERIRELMMDPFGNYVVQRALSVATHQQAVDLVEAMKPHLIASQVGMPNGQRNGGVRNTAGGRRIIAKICRRFPNFTLAPEGCDEYVQTNGYVRRPQIHHHQAPMMSYPGTTAQHYGDPRMVQPMQHQQYPPPQQPYYGAGGGVYYDPYNVSGYGM